jgi:hypothetical protein
VDRVNSSVIYLLYCNNFCKCYNVPPLNTTLKEKIKVISTFKKCSTHPPMYLEKVFEYDIFFFILVLGGVHCGIYKSSYNDYLAKGHEQTS